MKHVVAAVIEKDGRYLIAQRKIDFHLGGKWEFPGGQVEQGETPKEALSRELYEEFCITAEIGDLLIDTSFNYGDMYIKLSVYRVVSFSGEIVLNAHEKIVWIKPEDFEEYDIAEADIPVFKKLLE